MIADGQVVTLEYTVRRGDGTVLDSTGGCGPIVVMYGSGQLFPALEDRIGGMAPGETRSFRIPPTEAFGERRPDLVTTMPRDRLPADLPIEAGGTYRLRGPDGRGIPFRVVRVEGGTVTADFNDPRAGDVLEATVTVVAVRDATPEEERRGRV
jgi:FKBP-type peptidyl-prolyl cis-trans isomerase SlyD